MSQLYLQTGHYMLMEANGRRPSQKCQLVSPQIVSKTSTCLQFYYHMYGTQVNGLYVYAKRGNNMGAAIWSMRGNQGSQWQVGQVTLRGRGTNAFNVCITFHCLFLYLHEHWGRGKLESLCPSICMFIHPSKFCSGHSFQTIKAINFNPFPNKPWFLPVCSRGLLKTLWEKEKLVVTSNFSFSHSVF